MGAFGLLVYLTSAIVRLMVHMQPRELVPTGGAVGVGVGTTLEVNLLGPLEQFPWVMNER
jgi:hypothetical protein